MISAYLQVLNEGFSIEAMNDTNLVLIPKKTNPERISDFYPISLYNIVYKRVNYLSESITLYQRVNLKTKTRNILII